MIVQYNKELYYLDISPKELFKMDDNSMKLYIELNGSRDLPPPTIYGGQTYYIIN